MSKLFKVTKQKRCLRSTDWMNYWHLKRCSSLLEKMENPLMTHDWWLLVCWSRSQTPMAWFVLWTFCMQIVWAPAMFRVENNGWLDNNNINMFSEQKKKTSQNSSGSNLACFFWSALPTTFFLKHETTELSAVLGCNEVSNTLVVFGNPLRIHVFFAKKTSLARSKRHVWMSHELCVCCVCVQKYVHV